MEDCDVGVIAFVGEKGSNTSSSTGRVACEFGKGKDFQPIVLHFLQLPAKILFQSLIEMFSLSITFWVITWSEVNFHVQGGTQGTEEMRDELGTPITSNMSWDTVLREDMDDE